MFHYILVNNLLTQCGALFLYFHFKVLSERRMSAKMMKTIKKKFVRVVKPDEIGTRSLSTNCHPSINLDIT